LREVQVLVQVPVHGGSRKTDPPRKLAHRQKQKQKQKLKWKWKWKWKRKRKFGKSREYCLIDRTVFHIWSFGRGDFLRPEN
jgi:hypothetical protein